MQPTKTALRRDDLRKRLIDLAEAQIAAGGVATLKARDLATQAGCALGAIYNVFDDIPALVMQVNVRTFARLAVAAQVMPGAPSDQIVALGQAYLRFAAANFHLWRALFDLPPGPVPEWYQVALDDLFAMIEGPVHARFQGLLAPDRALMVKALFGSVHGIVLLGVHGQGKPTAEVERMVVLLLRGIGQ
jgi:AcrR family transcriptional regulator